MVKKNISKKQSARSRRRNIILILLGIAFAVGIVFFTVNTLKQDQLDRKDREKFTLLEARMEAAKTEFQKASPHNEWKIQKVCDSSNTPFLSDDSIGCSILLKTSGAVSPAISEQLLPSLIEAGFENGTTVVPAESQNKSITDLKLNIPDVFCSLVLTKASSDDSQIEAVFYCRSAAHSYVYPKI